MLRSTRMSFVFVLLFCLEAFVCTATRDARANSAVPDKAKVRTELAKKSNVTETVEEKQNAPVKLQAKQKTEVEQPNLPEDTSPLFAIKELRISGNTLISTDELLKNLPLVYNASDKPTPQAESGDLYDFRTLHDIILHPGQPREVSKRTMQGFTQYILRVYQEHGYAGIYVYIAAQAVRGGLQLQDEVLPVEVVEAKLSEIKITSYNTEREQVEKGILKSSAIEAWSPAKAGQVLNKKKLDYFVNLLNLNPDRYVSAVVSRGSEPNTLALGYEVYEADPWHYYIQLDNSGTEERQWAPRVGLINTNLTGIDDKLSVLYQAPWESGIEDNYLLFGSYEFPLLTPRLSLNVFGGRTKFDTTPEGSPLNFLGRGSFYGGMLSFNALQTNGWFLDFTTSLSHEKSEVTPAIFTTLESDIDMDLWAVGVNLHRSDDISNASVRFNRMQSISGSSRAEFEKAREGADPHFDIYTASAAYSRYIDQSKTQRLSGSFQWITTNERLAPSKMSTFGGLYSVRGYEEDEIIADRGILASFQYEFDLLKHSEAADSDSTETKETKNNEAELSKLAPLAFLDYARAGIEDPLAGEKKSQELFSAGVGLIAEFGDNFSASIYYGWPLKATAETDKGEGRLGISFTKRF